MSEHLPYDPGVLPTKPPPSTGQSLSVRVKGLPPYKDEHFSIRNPRHKIHARFQTLRKAAIIAMAGRAPYRGAVQLDLVMQAPRFERGKHLLDYAGGILDTLDGSHGVEFTYLPIVYEDDCQVAGGRHQFQEAVEEWYELTITFLPQTNDGESGKGR